MNDVSEFTLFCDSSAAARRLLAARRKLANHFCLGKHTPCFESHVDRAQKRRAIGNQKVAEFPYGLRLSFARNIAKCRFHAHANCNHARDCKVKALIFPRSSLWHVSCVVRRHVGPDFHSGNGGLFRRQPRVRGRMSALMSTWELILGSAGAALLTAYLVYALLRPERF